MKRLIALVLSLGLIGTACAPPRPAPVAPKPFVAVPSPTTVATPTPSPTPDPMRDGVDTDPVITPPPPPYPLTTGPATLVGSYVVGSTSTRYIPAFQYQLVYGDPLGGYNCTAYSMAMALDKATYGGSRITGRQVRNLTGELVPRGLSLPDVIRASDKVYVPIVNNQTGTWTNVMAYLRAGRGVILQGDYDQIPAAISGQLSFKGDHAIFIDHLSSTGRLYMMDPLQKVGARWVDESVLRAYAEKLARAWGVYPRVMFAVTRTTRLFN